MKRFFLLVASLSTLLLVSAQNYFRPGTVWQFGVEAIPPHQLSDSFYSRTIGEEVPLDGEKVMQYTDVEKPFDIIAYIKTEGEKIYVRGPKESDKEWCLIYNFGLQAGEGEVFTIPSHDFNPEKARKTYLKCIERKKSDRGDWEEMTMLYFGEDHPVSEEDEGIYYHEGKWIVGVGGTSALFISDGFAMDGLYTWLLQAEYDNKVLYKSQFNTSNVAEIDANSDYTVNSEGLSINVCGLRDNTSVSAYDVAGRKVAAEVSSEGKCKLTVPSQGLYLVRNKLVNRKIIVR